MKLIVSFIIVDNGGDKLVEQELRVRSAVRVVEPMKLFGAQMVETFRELEGNAIEYHKRHLLELDAGSTRT